MIEKLSIFYCLEQNYRNSFKEKQERVSWNTSSE